MDPRGLYPEMIVDLCDVVERKFYEMSTRLDASLADRDKEVDQFETSLAKDKMRKEFCRCLWC